MNFDQFLLLASILVVPALVSVLLFGLIDK